MGLPQLNKTGDWSYLSDFKMTVTQRVANGVYNVFLNGNKQYVLHTGNMVLESNFEYLVQILAVQVKKNTHKTERGVPIDSLYIVEPSQINSYFRGDSSDLNSIPILLSGRPTQ